MARAREGLGSADIQIAEDLFIAPVRGDEREGAMLFTSHSCDPNIAIQGQIVFVAMRDIAAGEELTHDWATTDDADYTMKCRCGGASCRGTITGKDWMNPRLQEKCRGWFCWFLQRKVDALMSPAEERNGGEGSGREWRTRGGEAASQSEFERTTPPRRSSLPPDS